jgi:hypothetical protein
MFERGLSLILDLSPMPRGDGLGDGTAIFNERSLLTHRMPLKRGSDWSGLIAELNFFEGSEAEDFE